MKRTLTLLMLWPLFACAVVPIKDLKLQGDANANTNRITNATDFVTASGVSLTNVAAGTAFTGNLFAVRSDVSGLGFATNYGPMAVLTGTVASAAVTNIIIGAGSSARLSVTNGGGPVVTLSLDAAGLATGTPLYVETDAGTNVSARLASNVWAAADSTTNYVSRTGGTYLGDWSFLDSDSDTGVLIQHGQIALIAGLSPSLVVDVNGIQVVGGIFGSGPGITDLNGGAVTNMPLTGLRITNTPSAGQVLATSNGTNGYWTTVSGGSGTQSPLTNTVNAAGYSITNAGTVSVTNRLEIGGTGTYWTAQGTTGLVLRLNGADYILAP